ncbi:MAG: tetratricopeptide repeat protein [candidate division KSB1 bacterium]|nr:tetratricopeptide repeat protein [candidate division KSB1 bacterium]
MKRKNHRRWKWQAIGFFAVLCLHAQTLPQQEVQNLRRLADAFEQAGLYAQAADYYIRLGLANPADLGAYLGAKRTCKEAGEWNKLRDFIQALQTRRRDVRYSIDLAWVDYHTGKDKEAKAEWRRIMAENPKDESMYAILGQTLEEVGFYEEAIAAYQTARAQLNRPSAFTFDLARLYATVKKPEEMINEYLLLMQENPQQSAFVRESFLQNQIDVEKALSILRKAEKQKPELAWAAALLRTDLTVKNSRYEEALQSAAAFESFLSALAGSKKSPPIHQGEILYELAEELFRAGLTAEAEKALLLILQKETETPYVPAARRKMAQVYLNRRQFREAEGVLRQIGETARQRTERAEAYEQLGKIYLEQFFDFAQAEAAFQSSLKEQTDEEKKAALMLRLAECAMLRGDFATAQERLTSVRAQTNPNGVGYIEAMYQTAKLQLYKNDFRGAKETVQQTLQAALSGESLLLENDLLQLSMLLQDAQSDSVGASVWAQADLLRCRGRLEEARELLSKRLAEAPSARFRDYLQLQLAQIFTDEQQYDRAVQAYKAVYENEKSPYRDYALFSIGALLETSGDKMNARQYYEKLLAEFPAGIYLDEARKRIRSFEKELP